MALQISHTSQLVENIRGQIKNYLQTNEPDTMGLKSLIRHIDNEFKTEDSWEQFETTFDQTHKDFFKNLKEKHPSLSGTQMRLSGYLKMNLSSKEIAALMNITIRGVEKGRSRLRKQLGLDANANLQDYIHQI